VTNQTEGRYYEIKKVNGDGINTGFVLINASYFMRGQEQGCGQGQGN
jgi:hypothetical protein